MKVLTYIKLAFSLTCFLSISKAQSVFLDNTFGLGGKVTTSIDSFGDEGNFTAIQSDGKILYGGRTRNSFITSDFALVRCNSDGSLDNTFGIAGKVSTFIENRSNAQSIAIQSNGKILLGGFSNWFINLARYNSNGSLDTTFGISGKVITDIVGYYSEKCKSVVIQSDGKILVGGYGKHSTNDGNYFVLVRYNNNGTLDSSFGTNGVVIGTEGSGYSLVIQNDGKILLGGSSNLNFALVRYNNNGTLDNSFGISGKVITSIGISSEANTLGIQSDGKILLGGYAVNGSNFSDFALARYNSSGSLDNSFGIGGKIITPLGAFNSKGNSLGIQSDGKILLAGNTVNGSNDFAIARYESNGTLDNSFGTSGKVLTPLSTSYSNCSSLSIQNDGKILLGGYAYNGVKTDMTLIRYTSSALSVIEETSSKLQEYIIFPNPFNSSTSIKFNSQLHNAEIVIFNLFGQVVKQKISISEQELQISRDNLQSGIYFLHLIENQKIISVKKLVIETD